ncbi:diacylglycerol kinase family protein [Lyngbya sp. CCY1209]|uniref:diacylglycerol kinase n=1 Tax=Lyngbya sp. CCY1209 TaxID=2886103 RepID=UPI002D1FD389|nr:diacylglycerol kinase family protein [Lyngbya sp. CCY1209]MEB3886073.1 diacylglycerol kinase family protein [Lyngbya sp. CCY1209]
MNAKKPSVSPLPVRALPRSQSYTYIQGFRGEPKVNPNRTSSWSVANNLLVSFKYAWNGVTYAFKTQRNFRIHTAIGTLAVTLGFALQLSFVELAVIGLTVSAVMAFELLNTAIESVVDLTVGKSYHELARIAKDCAAAAVLISALAALLVAGVLILPPLAAQIQQWI